MVLYFRVLVHSTKGHIPRFWATDTFDGLFLMLVMYFGPRALAQHSSSLIVIIRITNNDELPEPSGRSTLPTSRRGHPRYPEARNGGCAPFVEWTNTRKYNTIRQAYSRWKPKRVAHPSQNVLQNTRIFFKQNPLWCRQTDPHLVS